MKELIPKEIIESKIFVIRGQRVMVDRDLAILYGIETKVLNQSVKRNIERFPLDFMFSLTKEEIKRMSQIVTSLKFSKNINAFTQQGVAMLSSVLRSKKAVQANIIIMRTFVKLRHFISAHKELAFKLKELEQKIEKRDKEIQAIFEAIRQLIQPGKGSRKKRNGFHP